VEIAHLCIDYESLILGEEIGGRGRMPLSDFPGMIYKVYKTLGTP
jgi:hypothetical protein